LTKRAGIEKKVHAHLSESQGSPYDRGIFESVVKRMWKNPATTHQDIPKLSENEVDAEILDKAV
jgi:hypothetical protein